MGLKFYCYIDDDGRFYITDGMGGARVVLERGVIDDFIDALQKYTYRLRRHKEYLSIDSRAGDIELGIRHRTRLIGGDVRPLMKKEE